MSAFGRLKVGKPIRPERLRPSRAAASASELCGEVLAERLPQPLPPAGFAGAGGRPVEARADVGGKSEADVGTAQAQAPHDVGDGLGLAAVGFQELEPGRRGGEEVARLDPGARGLAAGLNRALQAVLDDESASPPARPAAGCGFRAATPRRSTAAPRRESRSVENGVKIAVGQVSRSRAARPRGRGRLRPCRGRRRSPG